MIKYRQKKLYVPKGIFPWTIIVILGLTIIGSFVVISNGTVGGLGKSDDSRSLGEVPKELQSIPNDPEKIAYALYKKTQKEYANTFNIIFFIDGYSDQKKALDDINTLENAINTTEPYKSLKDLFAYKIITTIGSVCKISDKKFDCDRKALGGLGSIGIEHFKLVVLSQRDFASQADPFRGVSSLMTLSSYKKNFSEKFIPMLEDTFGASFEKNKDDYARGVITCFYANKEVYRNEKGQSVSCYKFKDKYPNFWAK